MLKTLTQQCQQLNHKPREVQKQAIKWLESVWDSENTCKVLSMAVGAGKSHIAKTVAEYLAEKGLSSAIITPQNILIDQYVSDFEDINYFKGKAHYHCKHMGNCEDGLELAKLSKKDCPDCPYKDAKKRCYEDKFTIFNPISYYLLPKLKKVEGGYEQMYGVDTLIIDEVQSLPSMLRELCTIKLWWKDVKWEKGVSASLPKVTELLQDYSNKLTEYIIKPKITKKEKARLRRVQKKVDMMTDLLVKDSQYFICEEGVELHRKVRTRCLMIRPKYVPPSVYRNFFKNVRQVILMSGTMFRHIWEELGFRNVDYIDLPSPIPLERRKVFITNSVNLTAKASDYERFQTIKLLVQKIKQIVDELHPNENGVILLSYGLAEDLRPLLTEPHYLFMEGKETKKETLEEFKKGGDERMVAVLSGSYEGISLNNEMSRFTIIPKVTFQNIEDKVIKARLNDNQLNYALDAITTLIQATGRSTRNENDWSSTYILDSNFNHLYAQTRPHLPQYFKESLVWSDPTQRDLRLIERFRKLQLENGVENETIEITGRGNEERRLTVVAKLTSDEGSEIEETTKGDDGRSESPKSYRRIRLS